MTSNYNEGFQDTIPKHLTSVDCSTQKGTERRRRSGLPDLPFSISLSRPVQLNQQDHHTFSNAACMQLPRGHPFASLPLKDDGSLTSETKPIFQVLLKMVSKKEIFDNSGPKHLKDIVDWRNEDHWRSVTASLVQGVYILETDRQRTVRKNPTNYAQPWWQSFNFQLHQKLTEHDGCVFGAIYKYINGECPAPRFVIAFRGTILELDTGLADLILDLKCFFNELQESHRTRLAIQEVDNLITSNGSSNHVWLTGHSLGSAIALIVGRNLILKKGCYDVKAYLFNPPFASVRLETFINMSENMKTFVRIAGSIFKIGLAIAIEPRMLQNTQKQKQKAADISVLLSRWTPRLFVNTGDPLCSEYISYFKNRVEAAPEMVGLPAKNFTTRNLPTQFALGEDLKDAMHLLPSAHLIVNNPPPRKGFLHAHRIYQWWDPEVCCQSTPYLYNPQTTT